MAGDMSNVVVFPRPLGPKRQRYVPLGTVRLMESTAMTDP
jgi:hypothetical protein